MKTTDKDVIKWLAVYDELAQKYDSMKWNRLPELNNLLQKFVIVLSQLEHERANAHEKHNEIVFNYEGAVNRAIIEADHDVPELYMLRRIMEAGYQIVGSIRSNISTANKEN